MSKANRPKVRVQVISTPSGQPPKKPPKKKSKGGLCGILIVAACIGMLALIISCDVNNGNAAPASTPTPDMAGYYATATAVDEAAATNVASIEATDDPGLTVQPATPTSTRSTTPRPTAKPTQAPACQAVNGNPWCYNFFSGNLIYNPPSNFCDYFNCIASFWNGSGFVNECVDGSYSL